MKTFKDLEFEPHSVCEGLQARLFFPNGYGVSVVRFRGGMFVGTSLAGGNNYGSYTNDETEWELAVIKGDANGWSIDYDTEITDDVLGYLKEGDVTEVMRKVQELEPIITGGDAA